MKRLDSIEGGDSVLKDSAICRNASAGPLPAVLRLVAVGIDLQMFLDSLPLHTSSSSTRSNERENNSPPTPHIYMAHVGKVDGGVCCEPWRYHP